MQTVLKKEFLHCNSCNSEYYGYTWESGTASRFFINICPNCHQICEMNKGCNYDDPCAISIGRFYCGNLEKKKEVVISGSYYSFHERLNSNDEENDVFQQAIQHALTVSLDSAMKKQQMIEKKIDELLQIYEKNKNQGSLELVWVGDMSKYYHLVELDYCGGIWTLKESFTGPDDKYNIETRIRVLEGEISLQDWLINFFENCDLNIGEISFRYSHVFNLTSVWWKE